VAEENRPMKLLNHGTRHLSRHDSDDKKMADNKDADAFMLLYFLGLTRQVSNLLVVHLF